MKGSLTARTVLWMNLSPSVEARGPVLDDLRVPHDRTITFDDERIALRREALPAPIVLDVLRRELSAADVLKLRGELHYAAGTVIRTEA